MSDNPYAAGRQAAETHLFRRMLQLCGGGANEVSAALGTSEESLASFCEVPVRFDVLANSIGRGTEAVRPKEGSVGDAIEHRYIFSRWPEYDFVILESSDGMAWAQQFVRRQNESLPPVNVAGLHKWSHTEDEIVAALGAPLMSEEWHPWKSSTHQIGGEEITLCYVYGLLQNVRRHTLK